MECETSKTFNIGRREDNDIILKDISVSRLHAILFVSEGRIFIKDNASKFGTLLKTPN